jgi:hypothetical protein
MGMVRDMMRQPTVRKVLPLAVILLVVAAFGLASLSMKAPPYRPLTMMLSEADKQVALEALKTADFKPEIDINTGQITVPAARFHEAKMLIASKGLPRNDQQGIEGLKDMPAMTTSQFMEQVRYNNAMEQELSRSIAQIAGIKSARVHLASPKQSVFVRDRVPTKASVIITRAPGRAVSAANVTAITAEAEAFASRCKKMPKRLRDWDAYATLKKKIEDFQTVLPQLSELSKASIMPRHWEAVEKITGHKLPVTDAEFRLAQLIDAPLVEKAEEVVEVTDSADKELTIQGKLEEMDVKWAAARFNFTTWKGRASASARRSSSGLLWSPRATPSSCGRYASMQSCSSIMTILAHGRYLRQSGIEAPSTGMPQPRPISSTLSSRSRSGPRWRA